VSQEIGWAMLKVLKKREAALAEIILSILSI
jgi:hypothetical protein